MGKMERKMEQNMETIALFRGSGLGFRLYIYVYIYRHTPQY